jgi:hypothetical protein
LAQTLRTGIIASEGFEFNNRDEENRNRSEVFHLQSRWRVDGTKTEVFEITGDPAHLADWWGAVFMRVDILSAETSTVEGCLVRLYTKGWMPHTFHFLARVMLADGDQDMTIETLGDFKGVGRISLTDLGEAQDITIDWHVFVAHPLLKPVLRLLKPVFVANHRWAMRKGREGLQAEIHRRRGGDSAREPLQTPTFPHNFLPFRNKAKLRRAPENWSNDEDGSA